MARIDKFDEEEKENEKVIEDNNQEVMVRPTVVSVEEMMNIIFGQLSTIVSNQNKMLKLLE